MLHALRFAAISIAFVLAAASLATARPLISVGAGVASDKSLGRTTPDLVPIVSVGVEGTINRRWSAFARAGYTAQSRSEPGATCTGPNCPGVWFSERAMYVPVTVGLRVSSWRLESPRPFFEIAPSLSWARFEAETRLSYPDGRNERLAQSSQHGLPGFEIGGGVHHSLGGRAGLEWVIRYSYADGPRRTVVTEGVGPNEVSRLALVLALTL